MLREVAAAHVQEGGRVSMTKIAATLCLYATLWHVLRLDAPDFSGAAMFLAVPWAILMGRKHLANVQQLAAARAPGGLG